MKLATLGIRIGLALVGVVVFVIFLMPTFANATTWYVSPTGDDTNNGTEASPWRTISYAVSQVSDDDAIKVMDDDDETTDDYVENITVDKSLTISGCYPDGEECEDTYPRPQVKANNPDNHVFNVTADNVIIEGLDIYGATGDDMVGIYLSGVSNCTIQYTRCGWDTSHRNCHGIVLYGSSNNMVSDNTCASNLRYGIYSASSNNNMVSNNTCTSNRWCGITVSSSNNDTISGNTCSSNFTGMRCFSASPRITNNIIKENNTTVGHGGGIYCWNSAAQISNNIITGNYADFTGGGIYVGGDSHYSPAQITHNTIRANRSAYGGGGISCWGYYVSADITCNIIKGNSAGQWGGGIFCGDLKSPAKAKPTITNNIITANWGGNGGAGIHCGGGFSPTITNNTITRNNAGGVGEGGGIGCNHGSFVTITNTILWSNSPSEIYADEGSSITVTYSDVQGGWEGEGNIDADPLFVDADNGIYYLQAGSPCLSTAKPDCEGAPETDKDGQPRPLGSGCDMGSYEECDNGIFGYISASNCDISAYDASLVLQSVVGLIDLSERQKIAADVTGDGNVTALDAALILQYTVGLITQFPVQPGAPILTAKDENQILTKIIAELENVSLTTEQKHVLEQLKNLIGQQSIPSHTALLQNYPNPFNPETWLPYKLARDASVTIRIYNVKGRLIRTLHLGNKNAGVYMTKDKAAHWDGKDSLGQSVASGVYFYTLQVEYPDRNKAGIFTATRKMVIVK